MQRALLCLTFLLCFLCGVFAQLRCFDAEFPPVEADPEHSRYYYDVDVLAPAPIEITLVNMEFSSVETDRCKWAGNMDGLELYMNRVLFSYFPVFCSDRSSLLFSVSNLGQDQWGSEPRSPSNDKLRFETQYGRVDMRSGVFSPIQQASRHRNITIRLFSGSARTFMPVPPHALIVRVCLLARDVPADVSDTPYIEVGADENTVYPFSSCIYEVNGRCGAQLGYISTADAGSAVHIKRHGVRNSLSPAYVENGWTLPNDFPSGIRELDTEPHMHVGWNCEFDDVRWSINGSSLRLDDQTRRCRQPAAQSEAFQFGGYASPFVAMVKRPILPHQPKLALAQAVQAWADAGVRIPVISDRLKQKK